MPPFLLYRGAISYSCTAPARGRSANIITSKTVSVVTQGFHQSDDIVVSARQKVEPDTILAQCSQKSPALTLNVTAGKIMVTSVSLSRSIPNPAVDIARY